MYEGETGKKPELSAVDEIRRMAKHRLEQCLSEIDSLEKQAEVMAMHRRSLGDETSTLRRILEASQSETAKDVDLPRISGAGSSVRYVSQTWPG